MPAPSGTGWLLDERYRVLARIGVGGMAEVFRARDELLARDVAVKLFRSQLDPADSAGGRQRQQVELQALAQLSHPNLITLFDGSVSRANGHAYLVMELIDGPSLAARLEQSPLPEPEAREVAVQISDALGYVHARGMVHRDVKPANILLGSDATVGETGTGGGVRARLSDFGIVRLLGSDHLTNVNFMVGTASYLAPEQARGAEVGPAADVYALGLVLIEAMTGVRAYPGEPMVAVMARLERSPEIPPGLPEPWPTLLPAMTALDPADRPSAAEVARLLRGGSLPATGAMPNVPAAAETTRLAVPLAARPVGWDITPTSIVPVVPASTGVSLRADEPARSTAGWWLALGLVLLAALAVLAVVLIGHRGGSDNPVIQPSQPPTRASSQSPSSPGSTAPTTTAPSTTAPTTTAPTTTAPTTTAPTTTAPTTTAPTTTAPTTTAPNTTAPTSPADSAASGAPASGPSGTGSPTTEG